MFEFHGWAVLRVTPGDIENLTEEGKLESALVKALRAQAETHLDSTFMPWQLDEGVNGITVFSINGETNHRRGVVFEIFQWIAEHGSGSYGLLYVWDDEDHRGDYYKEFRVWRLARGTLTEHADPFLSACIPTTEDPYDPK